MSYYTKDNCTTKFAPHHLLVRCPFCGAVAGRPCKDRNGAIYTGRRTHRLRLAALKEKNGKDKAA